MKSIKEIKEEYKHFVESIPELLKQVEEEILKEKINFHIDEIEKIQIYYEENFRKKEIDLQNLNNCFYAYMGEAFIKHFGGNWQLCTLKNDEAYGKPVIVGWGPEDYLGPGTGKYPWIRISPFIWTEIIRERGTMSRSIRQIFEGKINRFRKG